jgi:hypothetical protein
MKEYTENELKLKYPIGSAWISEYGAFYVVGYDADADGIGYIVSFKKSLNNLNDNEIINIHPEFIHYRIN